MMMNSQILVRSGECQSFINFQLATHWKVSFRSRASHWVANSSTWWHYIKPSIISLDIVKKHLKLNLMSDLCKLKILALSACSLEIISTPADKHLLKQTKSGQWHLRLTIFTSLMWVSQTILTGLMSRCRNPASCMALIDRRIWKPSLNMVLCENTPLGWLRRNSARLDACRDMTR